MPVSTRPQETATLPHQQEPEKTMAQVLQLAVKHHQSGQIQDAEELYRSILQIQPNHPDANHNLGLLTVQAQRPAAGLPHFVAALEADLEQDQYWLSYIDALIQADQANIALQVLELGRQRGLLGEAVNNLARRLGMPPQAMPPSNTVQQKQAQPLAAQSGKSKTKKAPHKNLGRAPNIKEINTLVSLYSQGRFAEAETLARSLTLRCPLHGFGWKVLGAALLSQGRTNEALPFTQKAVKLTPEDASAHSNLGEIQRIQGQLVEAESSQRRALALKPDFSGAHNNLGLVLLDQGRLTEAEVSLRRALTLNSDFADAHNNLGIVLGNQDRLSESITSCRRSLEIQPNIASRHNYLLFNLSHDLWVDPQQLYAEHLAFGEQFEAPLRGDWQAHNNIKDPVRRLEVGFVSGDLFNHAIANFLEPVLIFLAKKESLSLHAYYTHTIEDSVTQRLQTYFPNWHPVASLSDAALAERVRADGIDVLIDLSSHTRHNRLLTFARKPAPIQISWMGYPGTTGLQAMDYLLCDQFYIHPELAWQFTEKLAYLPASAIFQPSAYAPAVNTLPALVNGYITFGSFNRPNKLNASVIALWSMLLRNIPNARMVLGAIPPDRQDALIQSFVDEGIEPSRLIFYPRASESDYMALHHQVDICLDTYPYGGGTTTAHAAWMGVPTLTLAGETPSSRVGATLANQFGLNQFIATSIEDFVDKGRYWVHHIDELAAIRLEMRARFKASAMGQPEPFADSLEVTLRAMWQRWCAGLPAVSL